MFKNAGGKLRKLMQFIFWVSLLPWILAAAIIGISSGEAIIMLAAIIALAVVIFFNWLFALWAFALVEAAENIYKLHKDVCEIKEDMQMKSNQTVIR